jgi:hypothetical protein
VYADDGLNPSSCSNTDVIPQTAQITSWDRISSDGIRLLRKVISSNNELESGPALTFTPAIKAPGNFDIYLEIPPCGKFDNCSARSRVKLEIFTKNPNTPTAAVALDQNVPQIVYARIFTGALSPTDPSTGLPFIRMTPMVTSIGSRPLSLVATALRLVYLPTLTNANGLIRFVVDSDGTETFSRLPGGE